MVADELLDVPLVPRLGPPALVVTARHVIGPVEDPVEAAGAKAVQVPTLAADDRHDRTFPAPDERNERRQVEVAPDPDAVRNGFDQRVRPPDVVETGREECEPMRAVTDEIVLEIRPDAIEVALEADALSVAEPTTVRARVPLPVGDERVDPRIHVAGRRRDARIEIDVEADRATLFRPERGQLAQPVPGHGLCHPATSFPRGGAIVCARAARSSRAEAVIRKGNLSLRQAPCTPFGILSQRVTEPWEPRLSGMST